MANDIKKNNRFVLVLAFLLLSILLIGINTSYVNAGVSNVNVCDESSFSGNELADNVWRPDGDDKCYSVKDGKLVFSAAMSNSAVTLLKMAYNLANRGVDLNECFNMQAAIRITEMPSGAKFGFLFGLSGVGDKAGDNGSMLWFDGNGNYGVSKFEGGTATELFSANTAAVEKNKEFNVALSVTNDGKAVLNLGETTNTVENVSTEGYMGFGTTGGTNKVLGVIKSRTEAVISELRIMGYDYATPTNTESYESFDYGYFNMNSFVTISKAGVLPDSSLSVIGKKLAFVNTGEAMLSTLYKYSNVEFSFDLDVQSEAEYKDGVLQKSISAPVTVAFGAESKDKVSKQSPFNIQFKADGGTQVEKGNGTIVQLMFGKDVIKSVALPEKYDIYNGKTISVRGTIVDGVAVIGLKSANENGFTEIFNYDLGYTPNGYVQILSADSMNASDAVGLRPETIWQGNFNIDNVAIINRDVNKKVVEVNYVSNLSPVPSDYVYVDPWDQNDLLSPNS